MATSVTKGGTQKLIKQFNIVETYWHDHSLEKSKWALSDGTISLSFPPSSGDKLIFWFFLKKTPQTLKSYATESG
jgi:hypothetical protein